MESSIVLNTGCIGFLPFLVQLLIHLSDDLIEKCGKAVEFFNSAVDTLQTIVVGLGGALCVWGGINLLEGYGQDLSLIHI